MHYPRSQVNRHVPSAAPRTGQHCLPLPKCQNEFLLKHMTPATYDTSNHTSVPASGLLLSSLCYAPLPIHINVQWSTPKWLKLHPEEKNCHYLNHGYSASTPKSTSSLFFFTIHYFYVPTWRKPATWTHRSGEDFTGVALLLL